MFQVMFMQKYRKYSVRKLSSTIVNNKFSPLHVVCLVIILILYIMNANLVFNFISSGIKT